MDLEGRELKAVGHWHWERTLCTSFRAFPGILYFGNWQATPSAIGGPGASRSNRQYDAFEFSFRGPAVRWVGSRGPEQGFADVFLDGGFCEAVDNYAESHQFNAVKFEKNGLSNDRVHTLRVVVKKQHHPNATDCFQDISSLHAEEPVVYPLEISNAMAAEYDEIQAGARDYLPPEAWKPVEFQANLPESGVKLRSGPILEAFTRNIDYINHSFASPTFCDGKGWSDWLPASNEGRLLQGAGNTLRWEEREDMRAIVDTLVDRIEDRMRDDGFYNYYAESDSYAQDTGRDSERKNYDRVFWTRGLLAAGTAGNEKAYGLLRRMYDWFNSSPYLPRMLLGGNATNGLPGGPLVHLSPAGKDKDLIITQRYYDQDYWINELVNREPLCLSHYPGERPHCYDLLGIESFADEYRATGAQKYLDAVLGAWDIYRENYKHIGGATAIMESMDVFPPKSYYFAERRVGETCGSVFWININSRLMQLFPEEEKYVTEIEEAIFNVNLANQDERGYIRYHTALHGKKYDAGCQNTCCEVSSAGFLARLPELVYSIAADGLYVNLFTSSEIIWQHGGADVKVTTATEFPTGSDVTLTFSNSGHLSGGDPVSLILHIRVPSWATGDMVVRVNGDETESGAPGSYLALRREWLEGDTVEFSPPTGFVLEKYVGLDQLDGNLDRYALLYGPVLMALVGELDGPGGVPRISVAPGELPELLQSVGPGSLDHSIKGYPGYTYKPYWQLTDETFTCFPVVEA